MSNRYIVVGGYVLHIHDPHMIQVDNRSGTMCGKHGAFTDLLPGQQLHPQAPQRLRVCKRCATVRDQREARDG